MEPTGHHERRARQGDVAEATGDLVGLLDRGQSERQHDVTLVNPCVPQRVQHDGAERDMARRRLGDRRPAAVVELSDRVGDRLVGLDEAVEHLRRRLRSHGLDQFDGCRHRIKHDEEATSVRLRARRRWRRPRTG